MWGAACHVPLLCAGTIQPVVGTHSKLQSLAACTKTSCVLMLSSGRDDSHYHQTTQIMSCPQLALHQIILPIPYHRARAGDGGALR
jgi:hypothetical protein